MGDTPHAYTVVGVQFVRDEVVSTEKVKAFDHDHPSDWKVDPVTGRPLWVEKEVFALNHLGKYDGEGPQGFEVDTEFGRIRSIYRPYRYSQGPYYIGLCLEDSPYREVEPMFIRLNGSTKIIQARDWLQSNLEPLGLWFPDRFGIYTVLG